MAVIGLPFGSEFSPTQVRLPHLLELVQAFPGDCHGFEASVKAAYFDSHETSEANRKTLAMNTRLAMKAYGLIDSECRLTEVGGQLYAVRGDEKKLTDAMASHILRNLGGATFVQCILDMTAAGETITLTALRRQLLAYGLTFPSAGRHASTMKLWLARAGLFPSGWRVDEERLKALLGTSTGDLDVLTSLDTAQRAFLRTLMNMGGPGAYPSNDIARLAEATYGVRFNEKSLPKQVLYPLQDAGFINLERGTREPGRGAKPFLVSPTERLGQDIIEPLLAQVEGRLNPDLRRLLRLPIARVLEDTSVADRHLRGLALEALAFKLIRLLGLDYVATRLRGEATGGAEVDLIFESSRLVFSRWQVQCKNTDQVRLDHVAKEVGLTHFLKSNVIVMVSTGEIGDEARRYANAVMKSSNLCIVMIDRADTRRISERPASIIDVFGREARHAMDIKKLDLGE